LYSSNFFFTKVLLSTSILAFSSLRR
jgi:hypothetical protein